CADGRGLRSTLGLRRPGEAAAGLHDEPARVPSGGGRADAASPCNPPLGPAGLALGPARRPQDRRRTAAPDQADGRLCPTAPLLPPSTRAGRGVRPLTQCVDGYAFYVYPNNCEADTERRGVRLGAGLFLPRRREPE